MQKTYSPKTYHIITFGCQANESDSSKLASILNAIGMEPAENMSDTDVLIINSCSVRQKSEDKVYGLAKKLKELEKKPYVLLSGCMVGSVTGERKRYPFEELEAKTGWVDVYISPRDLFTVPDYLIKGGFIKGKSFSEVEMDSLVFSDDVSGYVNISYGCDNFCSYCVVPYARGKEVFRSKEEIIKEVKMLLEQGINKITLCGQNVNSWKLTREQKLHIRIGDDNKLPFAVLLQEIHQLKGIEELSFISSNPFDFTDDLIKVLKLPKISNYLHIAVQSGNNDVLKRMNRRHTIEEFLELITKIRETKSSLEIGTDIIVGFPGETREQFMDTVKLFKKVKFDVAYIAMYSPRKGTLAEKLYDDDVLLEEKKWRHAFLTKVWQEEKKK